MAIDRTGNLLATGSGDGRVELWYLPTGRQVRCWEISDGGDPINVTSRRLQPVFALAFSPDGTRLAVAAHAIQLFDVKGGARIKILSPPGAELTRALAFRDDDKVVATDGRETYAIDTDSGAISGRFKAESGGHFIALSRDGMRVAENFDDYPGAHLNIRSTGGAIISRLDVQTWDVTLGPGDLVALQNGSLHAPDGLSLEVWSSATGRLIQRGADMHLDALSLAFSDDGRFVVLGSDADLLVWDRSSNRSRKLRGHTAGIWAIAFGTNQVLATGGDDLSVRLWDLNAPHAANSTARDESFRRLSGAVEGDNRRVSFSPDGSHLIAGSGLFLGEKDELVLTPPRLWDLTAIQALTPLEGGAYAGRITFSHDGELVAGADDKSGVRIWSTADGHLLRTIDPIAEMGVAPRRDPGIQVVFPTNVTFLPNRNLAVTIENHVGFWDLPSGAPVRVQHFPFDRGTLTLSPDGRFAVLTGTGNGITVFDTATGAVRHRFEGSGDEAVAIAADGRTLAVGVGHEVQLFNLETKAQTRTVLVAGAVGSVALSRDGQHLAVAQAPGYDVADLRQPRDPQVRIPVFATATGQVLASFAGHPDGADSVAFSPDARLLASVGPNSPEVQIWSLSAGRKVAQLTAFGQRGHLALTPDGYYAASRDGLAGVSVRLGDRAFPIEQWDLEHNRPDIVLGRLGVATASAVETFRRAAELRRQRVGAPPAGDRAFHAPPEVRFATSLPLSTREKHWRLAIEAKDGRQPISRVVVRVNDVPIGGTRGFDVSRRRTKSLRQEVSVELSTGLNRIEISAVNALGTESIRESRYVTYSGLAAPVTLHVIAIGVGDFPGEAFDLAYAKKDAHDIATFFEQRRAEGIQVRTQRILDGQATRASILTLKEQLMKTRVDDAVVLFLAGHGVLDQKRDYYFATSDMDFRQPSRNGLSFSDLNGLLDGIPARKKLLLIDTCHSGEVDKGLPVPATLAGVVARKRGLTLIDDHGTAPELAPASPKSAKVGTNSLAHLVQELFADLHSGSGTIVLSAASGYEVALESEQWRNGVFTASVLEGLQTRAADLDHDATVRASELREYVVNRVRTLTSGVQSPTARAESIEFDFPVLGR